MLEGKEFEQQIGQVKVEIDLTPEGKLKIGAEADLLGLLKELAAKTSTPVDDVAVAWIEKVLGAAKALS